MASTNDDALLREKEYEPDEKKDSTSVEMEEKKLDFGEKSASNSKENVEDDESLANMDKEIVNYGDVDQLLDLIGNKSENYEESDKDDWQMDENEINSSSPGSQENVNYETATKKKDEQPMWLQEKEKCLNASIDEHKNKQPCTELASIETWPEYYNKNLKKGFRDAKAEMLEMSKKVSIWKGDITTLLVDVIVNAANEKLLGGGGVDKAIHKAAGPLLKEECRTFGGASAGETIITAGYNLPAKYVIHAVGPRGENPDKLRDCYLGSLQRLIDVNQRTIAFPCISTGIFGYPNDKAADVVVKAVLEWLRINHEKVDRVIFCLFMDEDIKCYHEKLQKYFPMKDDNTGNWSEIIAEFDPMGHWGKNENVVPSSSKYIDEQPPEKKKKGLQENTNDEAATKKKDGQPMWMQEKEKCLNASIDERQNKKPCTELASIDSWPEYYNKNLKKGFRDAKAEMLEMSKKVSIWKGDITTLLVDVIVNAANEKLLGGGGVDKAIHKAAGPLLKEECRTFGGASAGETVITAGYNLPAKYVIHAVGPRGENPDKLRDCYLHSLQRLIDVKQRSIAFPCISTGDFGYPNDKAADVVVKVVLEWLEINHEKVDRVIFCLFMDEDIKCYHEKLQKYFPMKDDNTENTSIPVTDENKSKDDRVYNFNQERKPLLNSGRKSQETSSFLDSIWCCFWPKSSKNTKNA